MFYNNIVLDPFLTNTDGSRAIIQTKYHRGEKSLWNSQQQSNAWPVDGFAETDHGCKVYEFMGDAWHAGCPHCQPNQTNQTWARKRMDIVNAGHQLEVIWECQWNRMLPNVKYHDTPLIPDILNTTQTEQDILDGIKSGRLYGYILCDVTSPDEVIEARKHFPPVLKRIKIGPEHLTPFTADQLRREKPSCVKFERETLVQCFHATNHLLLTPLAQYYMSIGIKLSNVRKFIQYIPRASLTPFVQHVTEMRISAEQNNMPTKGNTAKNFGNCGYGKVISGSFFLLKFY